MPHIPLGVNGNILSTFSAQTLEEWINGANIPKNGPHTQRSVQHGCTINTNFTLESTRSRFEKGMQGHLLEEADTSKGKEARIFVEGVTEHWHNSIWVNSVWVPASIVAKGAQWKPNFKDWAAKMDLTGLNFGARPTDMTIRDSSTPGKTIARLIQAFNTSPAPFMGTQLQDLLQKRKWNIDTLTSIIIQGIKDAGLHTTLNKPDFTMTDILGAARHTTDTSYPPHTAGGIYVRYHKSGPRLKHWLPNTTYAYIGKTTDYKERFISHKSTTRKYGDLTRNSQMRMAALCVIMTGRRCE